MNFTWIDTLFIFYSYISNGMSSQVSGLSDLLKSNLDRGVSSNEDELLQRRDIFGANTYPRRKRKSIWVRSSLRYGSNFFRCALSYTEKGFPPAL